MEKSKKLLFIAIFILIVILVVGIIIFKNNGNKNDNPKTDLSNKFVYSDNDCINKGNICSDKEIIKGIKVTVNVGENQKKDFYVLNNTENEINLISSDMVSDSTTWNEFGNYVGPATIFSFLSNYTLSWSNIPLIKDYQFNDSGYEGYYNACLADEDNKDNEMYDCDNMWKDRGYEYLTIKDGELFIKTNVNISSRMGNNKVRIPEKSEIEQLMAYNQKISWLQDTGDFWLLDTITNKYGGYNSGAYYVSKKEQADSGIVLKVSQTNVSNAGLRAVLTLSKDNIE